MESLRHEVISLLDAPHDGDDLLERPAIRYAAEPLQAGAVIGHYRIEKCIGVGGMGEVYSATDTKLDRKVAIKILPDAFANDPERLARFQREAKVLASLNHPNIAIIHGVEEGTLILELVEGPTIFCQRAPYRWRKRWPSRARSPRRSRRHTKSGSSTAT